MLQHVYRFINKLCTLIKMYQPSVLHLHSRTHAPTSNVEKPSVVSALQALSRRAPHVFCTFCNVFFDLGKLCNSMLIRFRVSLVFLFYQHNIGTLCKNKIPEQKRWSYLGAYKRWDFLNKHKCGIFSAIR